MKDILQAIIDDKPLTDSHGTVLDVKSVLRRLGEGLPVQLKPLTTHRYVPVLAMPAGTLVLNSALADPKSAMSEAYNGRLPSERLVGILHVEIEPETLTLVKAEITKL